MERILVIEGAIRRPLKGTDEKINVGNSDKVMAVIWLNKKEIEEDNLP